jgi:transcriptional regulator with XRE-family HTH domain
LNAGDKDQRSDLPPPDHPLADTFDTQGVLEVGRRIRAARQHLGLTQKALAAISGIPLPSHKDYEGGKRMPGGRALSGYAKARINVSWLLGDESAPMLLDSVENAEKTAVYTAALLGDEEAQRLVDQSHQASMEKLVVARELVEKVVAEFEFQPGRVMMGALLGAVRLGRMNEDGVRDVVRALMVEAAMKARS